MSSTNGTQARVRVTTVSQPEPEPIKPCEPESIKICEADERFLTELEMKLQCVRDLTGSVASGRTTGLYLHGKGGCGKSFTVLSELDRLQIPYKLFNSRMTGRGLYNALEEFPDSIHLLEDMEQIFRDSGARGVLRSALWCQGRAATGRLQRRVTWSTHRMEHSFVFTGGIIMTANRPFPDLPELAAVKTRIAYTQLVVSDNELIALMRQVASQGHRCGQEEMDAEECSEVCAFIIDECRGLNRSLDMRLLINGYQDYLQWSACQSGCHWHDLLATRIKQRPIGLEEARTHTQRASQKEDELRLAKELEEAGLDRAEMARRWHEQTGKSEQTLYRRREELKKRQQGDSQ